MPRMNTLDNVTLKVEISKFLSLRLRLFTLLLRLACWVGSVNLEVVTAELHNTGSGEVVPHVCKSWMLEPFGAEYICVVCRKIHASKGRL